MFNDGNTGFKKLNTINRRMFIISAAKAVVFTGIIARLFSLQINENKKYLTLSDNNRLREWRLPPVRGDFLDFFGKTIAGNIEVYQLHIIPEEVSNFKALMVRLKEILDLTEKEYSKILRRKRVYVKNGLLKHQANSFYRSYLKSKKNTSPFVTCKLAISKDFFTVNKQKNKFI